MRYWICVGSFRRTRSLLVLSGVVFLLTGSARAAPSEAVRWNTAAARGWEIADDGTLLARNDFSEIQSSTILDDFALNLRFRFGKEVATEVPLSLRFHSRGKNSEYSLDIHKALGILLSASGRGLIAGLAPGAPWPPGSSPRALDPEKWYRVRLQALGNRIAARIWPADQDEPAHWGIDVMDSSGKEELSMGKLEFAGARSATVGEIELSTPTPFPEPARKDLRMLRYKRRVTQATDFQVIERPDEIEILGERARFVFSRKGCSVSRARMRGELFQLGHLPDLRYVTADGTEYRQSHALDGELKVKGVEGNYLVLEGKCRPADEKGRAGPARFVYRYRIHRELGMVLVAVRCEEKTPVRRFEFIHSLEDRPEQGMDYLHSSILWGQGQRHPVIIKDRWGSQRASINMGPVSREDRIIVGEQLMFARWTNGKAAFEVQALSYGGSEYSLKSSVSRTDKVVSIEAGGFVYSETPVGATMLDDLTSEKYLVARTRGGKRSLDMVFINLQAEDAPISIGMTDYTFSFQFLPFRKYRPNLWLNGYIPLYSWCVEIDSISWRTQVAREAARMGLQATHLGIGHLPHTILADVPPQQESLGTRRVRRCVESLHAAGLRVAPGWWWSSWDCQHYVENGWLTAEDVGRARTINHRVEPDRGGVRRGAYPHSLWIDVCYNDEKIRKTLVEKLLFGFIDEMKCDGVYLDGFVPWIPCENSLHGCQGPKRQTEGYIELVDQFRELAKKSEPLEAVLWGHPGEHVYGPHGLSDIAYLGEMFVPPWVPTKSELEGYFSSLLHGSQVVYCSAPGNGGPDWEDVRVYEGALSRCALVQAPDPVVNAWIEKRPDDPGLQLWRRCMLPLGVFDVNDSEVHHPFDVDYREYASGPEEGATVILYHRPGDVLLVAVREIDKPSSTVSVRLKTQPLGLDTPKVWLFDTASLELKELETKNGQIDLGKLDLARGPRILRLLSARGARQPVWHDQVVWRVETQESASTLQLNATGVPESDGILYLACSRAPSIDNGELLSYDPESSLATVRVRFDASGRTHTSLTVATARQLSYGNLLARLTKLPAAAAPEIVVPGSDFKAMRSDSEVGTRLVVQFPGSFHCCVSFASVHSFHCTNTLW